MNPHRARGIWVSTMVARESRLLLDLARHDRDPVTPRRGPWRICIRERRQRCECVAKRRILPSVIDDEALGEWCHQRLEDGLGDVLFRSGHLSEVVGVQLTSGRQVVVKVRPYRLAPHRLPGRPNHLARMGFPCPAPLTGATRLGELAVTAETAMPGGCQLSPESGAAPFAALLARLIDSAPDPSRTPTLAPSPPWTGWDHPGATLRPDARR